MCYHVRRKVVGGKPYDVCDLDGTPCLLVLGSKCKVYEDHLKEKDVEDKGNRCSLGRDASDWGLFNKGAANAIGSG